MLRENISVVLKAGSSSLLGMKIANPYLKKRKINGSVTAGDSVLHLQQQCYIHTPFWTYLVRLIKGMIKYIWGKQLWVWIKFLNYKYKIWLEIGLQHLFISKMIKISHQINPTDKNFQTSCNKNMDPSFIYWSLICITLLSVKLRGIIGII